MCQWQALILGLLSGLLVGCANEKPVRAGAWLDRWRPFPGPAAADVVEIRVSLVERPPGDSFINQELWTLADEQIIPLERKAALEENGFRIGQVGGNTPAGLLSLLTSGRSNVNPRGLFVHAGQPTSVALGPMSRQCSFSIRQDGESASVCLDKAQCAFDVVPTFTGDGRTRLQFTPLVRHGDKKLVPKASGDSSGFILQEEWPTNSYPSLAWEVTLAPNQYVVVGARLDHVETLGYQCFLRREESVPVQRLLVIGSRRMAAPTPEEIVAEASESHLSPGRSVPLALQAAWTKARGSSP